MSNQTKPIITIPITGNTYPVRAQLFKLGGKWDPQAKAWMVPEDKAEEAKKLVLSNETPRPRFQSEQSSPRPTKCKVCGVNASRRVRIYRSGECQDCYEERKMGY